MFPRYPYRKKKNRSGNGFIAIFPEAVSEQSLTVILRELFLQLLKTYGAGAVIDQHRDFFLKGMDGEKRSSRRFGFGMTRAVGIPLKPVDIDQL